LADRRPVLDDAGNPVLDKAGEPKVVMVGKYGMHSLRHACASLWIENGYNPKQIQRLMGHSSIKVTFDVYGHLFSDAEADQRAAGAPARELKATPTQHDESNSLISFGARKISTLRVAGSILPRAVERFSSPRVRANTVARDRGHQVRRSSVSGDGFGREP
jgi:hypothetical protein